MVRQRPALRLLQYYLETFVKAYMGLLYSLLPAGGTQTIDGLADVIVTSNTKGDLLVCNGTNWIDVAVGNNDYILTADSNEATGLKWAAAATPSISLDGLSDVVITSNTKGDLMVCNGTNWIDVGVGSNDQILTADSAQASGVKWAAPAALALDGLSDVTIAGAVTGDTLVFNGSAWVDLAVGSNNQILTADSGQPAGIKWADPAALAIDGLSDVVITSNTKGDLLVCNGTNWIDVAVGTNDHVLTADSNEASGVKWAAAGGAGSLDGLSDVAITSQAKGDILASNGTNFVDLTVGTNGQVIVADSGETTGIKWAAPSTLAIALDNLSDVAITSQVKGDILASNGTNFVDLTVGTAYDLLISDSSATTGIAWSPPLYGARCIGEAVNRSRMADNSTATGANIALSADTIYVSPLTVTNTTSFDSIQCNISTAAAAGKVIRMGVYNANQRTGYPTTLVTSVAGVAADSTGIKSASISATLTPGLYYIAIQSDGTPTIQFFSGPGWHHGTVGDVTTNISASGMFSYSEAYSGGMVDLTGDAVTYHTAARYLQMSLTISSIP